MPYAATVDSTEHYLQLLTESQLRETQLEAAYLSGRATVEQLHELEQVRLVIEDCQEALDVRGYFNPS
jgi:hypothetical protein